MELGASGALEASASRKARLAAMREEANASNESVMPGSGGGGGGGGGSDTLETAAAAASVSEVAMTIEEDESISSTIMPTQPEAKRARTGDNKDPVLKFRNYAPVTEEVNASANLLAKSEPPSIENAVEATIQAQKDNGEADITKLESTDLLNLAPQKVDWDLKRDLAPKLAKLERRTQRAIAELVRDRLAKEAAA